MTESYAYNNRIQLTGITATKGATALLGLGYSYDASSANNGNVLGQTITTSDGLKLSQVYLYDAVNRLCGAGEGVSWSQSTSCSGLNGSGSSWWQGYTYDSAGNRAVTGVMPNADWTPQDLTKYTGNRWIRQTNGGDGYDADGNQTSIASNASPGMQSSTFSFDAENRMVKANIMNSGDVHYIYDGEGHRVQKIVGAVATTYAYDAAGQLTSESGGATDPGVTEYVTADSLGSTRLVTSANGTPIRRSDYMPFGEDIAQGTGGRGPYYLSAVSFPVPADSVVDEKFTSKERDSETGLDYFGARYFSSAQGRYTTPDIPFADQRSYDPQSWNLYAYGRNNPLKYVDPTGKAIELVGDDDERKKQLSALQQAVGKQAGSYLYQNPVTTTNADGTSNTRYFVGVLGGGPSGKGPDFGSINSVASDLAGVIKDQQIAQVRFVDADQAFTFFSPTGRQTSLNSDYTGLTSPYNEPSPIKIWVLNPDSAPYNPLPGRVMSDGRDGIRSLSDNLVHELGHAAWQMDGKAGRSSPSDPSGNERARTFENDVRRLRGGAERLIH